MKTISSLIEKIFTPLTLVVFNIAIIVAMEIVGVNTNFAENGAMHAFDILFVGLILLRIFSDYAYSDHILKGFLKIQLTFFLFFGFVHLYEYFAEYFFMIREDVVDLTVMASYFVWFISIFLSLGFVFQIYYKMSRWVTVALWGFFAICFTGLVAPNISAAVVAWFPLWFPKLILVGIVTFAIAGIFALRKLREIMPVFKVYSYYVITASILLTLNAFVEYFESIGGIPQLGISALQNHYLSHFVFYVSLSVLLVGFGKLEKPKGIYEDMVC